MVIEKLLLALRLLELAMILIYAGWVAHTPPSDLRKIRMTATWALIVLNLTVIVLAVGWAKVTLW